MGRMSVTLLVQVRLLLHLDAFNDELAAAVAATQARSWPRARRCVA